ncbi:DUF3060 domain-containing protein [Streptomyces sp. 7N604]|uniref:DUF3060 domain-containing protein n=1 Tax=Streptomyces sp. 7N604 TaxID=3457415 RepID=UPI003FD54EF2
MRVSVITAVGVGLAALAVSACQVGVVDKAPRPTAPTAAPPDLPDAIEGRERSSDAPTKSARPTTFTATATPSHTPSRVRPVEHTTEVREAPETSDKPRKPSSSPTSPKPQPTYGAGVQEWDGATIDCQGREVVIEASGATVGLRGECPSVSVYGDVDDIVIDRVGEVTVYGENNDVSCGRGLDGAQPRAHSNGGDNDFTGCGTPD